MNQSNNESNTERRNSIEEEDALHDHYHEYSVSLVQHEKNKQEISMVEIERLKKANSEYRDLIDKIKEILIVNDQKIDQQNEAFSLLMKSALKQVDKNYQLKIEMNKLRKELVDAQARLVEFKDEWCIFGPELKKIRRQKKV